VAAGTLTELPGVGDGIARVVTALHEGEPVPALDRLRERWPRALVELAMLPGVGLKKARALLDHLGVDDLDALTALIEAGRAREIGGIGPATEARILAALRGRHTRDETLLLIDARRAARGFADYLAAAADAAEVHVAGPTRRWFEIVDELVVVVATAAPAAVAEHVRRHPLVLDVVPDGEATLRLRLASGGRGRVVLAPLARVGAALIAATGSEAHVAALRARAAAGGRELDALEGDEAAVYAALGLPWVPPEVRDGDDELGRGFADLVTLADLRGAVHCHTDYSDGRATVAQMAGAAAERDLAFMTITDHSRAAFYANGLDDERTRAQWREIAEVQRASPVRLLRGVEADILADGALDVSPALADGYEVVIASIHNRHKLDEDAQTRRLITALRQPVFKIWGHALGRMLPRREPIAVRFDDVLDAIAASPCAIELNGDPHRLDLDPVRARQAAARGIRFVLSSDAHSTRGLDAVEYAVAMARRARLRPADILNTLPTSDFIDAVRPTR
jgi:DNA polymerase (family 10)